MVIRVNVHDVNVHPGQGYITSMHAEHYLALADTITIRGVLYVVEDETRFSDHNGQVQTVFVTRCQYP